MTIKYIRYGLWALVGLAFMGFIAFNLPQDEAPLSIQPLAGFNQGAHFTLTTHQGESFDSESKIAEGEYALLFFGFTHCPVICPTELQKVAEILDGLSADKADKIHPLFITIDPERDTVETLQNYVPLFHDDIMGLTGTVDDIHKTLDDWKVFYTKVDDPQFTEYTMDHSTYLYLVDHTMTIKALYRMKNTPEQIIKSLNSFI